MTTISNFDCNSQGVNIELNAFYDTMIARMDFEENFHGVNVSVPDGFYGEVYFFTCFGADVFIENDTRNYKVECNSKTLIRHLIDFCGGDVRDLLREVEVSTRDDVRTILGQIESHLYYENEINDFYSRYFEPDFQIYETRGYSQGDVATIIVDNKTELTDSMKQLIDNLFWDQPIYARLECNGEEYYLDENVDRYDYDKDNMIEQFKKDNVGCEHFDQIVEFLSDNLPESLDYV